MQPDIDLPAAFAGHAWLYLVTVFSLLLTLLLALEWTWRLLWSFVERPFGLKHPQTVVRLIILLFLIQLITRLGPDVWLVMRWPQMSGAERIATILVDSRMDTTSFVWMVLAWLLARLGEPYLGYQLEKQPLPVHLWPTGRQMKRPLYICFGVFLISFALTYLR